MSDCRGVFAVCPAPGDGQCPACQKEDRIADLERELTIIKHMILANRYHFGNFPQDLVDAALQEKNDE